jgi:predicted amidohydrolase YtcJ
LRVRHATRHASLLNSRALSLAAQRLGALGPGVAQGSAEEMAPGLVVGNEAELTRFVGPISPSLLDAGLEAVSTELARRGVASVDDVTASNDAERIAVLASAAERGLIRQRVRAYVRDADEVAPARRAARGHIDVVGVKLLARAAEEASSAEFRAAVERARRAGFPVAVHAVEADVVAAVLDVLESASPRVSRTPDRLEHCSLCPPELAGRIARAGIAVVTQPAFLVARGAKYRAEVEKALWPWLYPLRTLRDAGVLVVGGSDAPVVPLDPALGLRGARARSGDDATPLAPSEALDDAAVLDLFTGAARRLRGEAASAELTTGARADIALLDHDPRASGWRSVDVRCTVIGGRVHA